MTDFYQAGLFDSKVVLVTGGGSGIGQLAARAFGQLGADVVIASRDESKLNAACDALVAEGIRASWRAVDVRDPERVHAVVDGIAEDHGGIDIAFLNAGGQFALAEEELTANGWRSVIDLNLNGTFHCASAVGRQMIAAGRGGKIVNMAVSFADGRGSPGIAHRGAAAAGVVHLTRSLALAWAEYGIQVNAIGPQYMTPGVMENYAAAIDDYIPTITPMKRWGADHEIAGAVVFLASPIADYITGVLLPVDGGAFIGPGVNYRGTAVLDET
jgi:NAD(P)-dependent dehydrogenase (short-subunit alcohol dehydrogenase family)